MDEFGKYKPEAKFFHYLMRWRAPSVSRPAPPGPPVRRLRELDRHRSGPPLVWTARPTAGPAAERAPHPGRTAAPRKAHVSPAPSTAQLPPPRRRRRRGRRRRTNSSPVTAAASRPTRPTTCQPVVPSKVIAVHLNHRSRVDELQIGLPDTPIVPPQADLLAQQPPGRDIVRPEGCKWLNPARASVATVIADRAQHRPGRRGVHRRAAIRRQRLRPARLPRHRRRVHAPGQRARHVPARPRPSPTGTSAASGCARTSTARSSRTARPTR